MQKWECLLDTTGGKLEAPKCKFTIMSWKSTDDGIPELVTQSPIDNIKIKNSSTGATETVPSIPADESYKLLGVQIAMDGNMTKQNETMLTKGKKLATTLAQCQFHPGDIATAYHQDNYRDFSLNIYKVNTLSNNYELDQEIQIIDQPTAKPI